MKDFSQYVKSTGRFTSHIMSGCRPRDDDEHGWREGIHDHESRAIDPQTGDVVEIDRSVQTDTQRQRRRVLAQLAEIERKQARRVREILAESDQLLKDLDDQAVALRAQL